MSYDEHLISMAGGDGDGLDQIQARADAATEGPWTTKPYGENRHHTDNGLWVTDLSREIITDMTSDKGEDWEPTTRSNMDFIAHARTDIPALLAMVREQRAVIERVRELHVKARLRLFGSVEVDVCGTCVDDTGLPAPWPCLTIAALTTPEQS